ncbi:hypothetical protein ACHAWF_002862 [Thalassiosira exigua]
MVIPPGSDDFYSRALASFNQQMAASARASAAAADVESRAKALVEDGPKIDAAVKAYLSLVAARSATASDVDVVPDGRDSSDVRCTLSTSADGGSPADANRRALACARTLLSAVNSTTIPAGHGPAAPGDDEQSKVDDEEKAKAELQADVARVLWNGLVQSSRAGGDKAKRSKPSRALGRESLSVAYPYIRERFRRGIVLSGDEDAASISDDATTPDQGDPIRSVPDEALPPIGPPNGIDVDQWRAFYTEFGSLLSRACGGGDRPQSTAAKTEDDSALLWSSDGGAAELRRRREMRAQRASEAAASVDGAKAAVKDALG